MSSMIQTPDSLSLLMNLKSFIIASYSEVTFALKRSGTALIEETYYPDTDGHIEIQVRDVISRYLSISLPSSDQYDQASAVGTFVATVDGTELSPFTVIAAGVRKPAVTTAEFLQANWLTWQPQTKQTTWATPEYLSYYFAAAALVRAKFYLKAGTTSIITVATGTAGHLQTFNMTMSRLFSLASIDPDDAYGIVDTWVETTTGTQLSYVQRYACADTQGDEHVYLAVNSLGGIDTFIFHGECRGIPELEHEAAELENELIDATSQAVRKWRQGTGYLGLDASKWLFELVAAPKAWAVVDGNAEKIIIDADSVEYSDRENVSSGNFTWQLAEEGRLLNMGRTSGSLPVLEVPSPDGAIFFLEARLIDYPDADLTDTLLFLLQSPYANAWKKASLAAILANIYQSIIASPIGQMAHSHANGTVLAKLSEASGRPLYDGNPIALLSDITETETLDFLSRDELLPLNMGIAAAHSRIDALQGWIGRPVADQMTADLLIAQRAISLDGSVVTYDATTGSWNFPAGLKASGDIRTGGKVYIGSSGAFIEVTPEGYLHTNVGFYSDRFVSGAGLSQTSGGSTGGGGAIATLTDVTLTGLDNGHVLVYDSTSQAWVNRSLGLGSAATYGIGMVAQGDEGLVTGGSVYSAIMLYLSAAIRFAGITTTALTDGSTTATVTIDGASYTAHRGDEVIYGSREFLWTGTKWQQLGDEESWALKTITITGTGYLTGGGSLAANRTIDIAQTYKEYIEHGQTAYNSLSDLSQRVTVLENRTNWDDYLEVTQDGHIHVKGNRGFYSDNFISGAGLSSTSAGSGGMDADALWQLLAATTSEQIASSHLTTALAPYATRAWVLEQNFDADLLPLTTGLAGAQSQIAALQGWIGRPVADQMTADLLIAQRAISLDGSVVTYDAATGSWKFPAGLTASGDIRTGGKVYIGTGGAYIEVTAAGHLHTNVGFYSDSFLSGAGLSQSSGSGSGGGAIATLTDVTLAGLSGGHVLMYDSTSQAWVNRSLGLGSAATYGIGMVAQGDTGLVTGGSVYSAIMLYLSAAIRFAGITTTVLTDGSTTSTVTIDGASYTAQRGDEVIYGSREFLWTGSKWQQLGDEESWALKTITITGTGYLTGGGTLAANRTIDIAQTYKEHIEHGQTAYGWGNHANAGYLTSSSLTSLTDRVTALENRSTWDDNILTVTMGIAAVRARVDALQSWFDRPVVEQLAADEVNTRALRFNGDVIESIVQDEKLEEMVGAVIDDLHRITMAVATVEQRAGDFDDWLLHPVVSDLTADALQAQRYISLDGSVVTYDAATGSWKFPAGLTASGDIRTGGKVYIGTGGAYIEVTAAGHLHTNVGFYSDSFLSGAGLSQTSGGEGIDTEALWQLLAATTSEQIAASHLTTALAPYATREWVQQQGFEADLLPLASGLAMAQLQIEALHRWTVTPTVEQLTADEVNTRTIRLAGRPVDSITTEADLAAWGGSANITKVGTITTGTWQGTAIANTKLTGNGAFTLAGRSIALGATVNQADVLSDLGLSSAAADISALKGYFTSGIANQAAKVTYALTFGSKTYDGSAAKTITASDLGALTSHQSIYDLKIYNSAGTRVLWYVPTYGTEELTLTKAMVGLGSVENTALSTWGGSANITKVGTITSGTWQGTAIANSYLANSSISLAGRSVSLGGSISANTMLSDLGLSNAASDISTLQGYFTNGAAKKAIADGDGNTISSTYLKLSGGTLTGDLRMGGGNYGRRLYFGDGSYCYISEDSDDVMTLYGKDGIKILTSGSSSAVSVGSASLASPLYIYGRLYLTASAYLEYSSGNAGIHSSVGIYSDSWLSGAGLSSTSDVRLKTNIKTIDERRALAVVDRLRPVEFQWRNNGRQSAGFVAQEVEPTLPFSVHEFRGTKHLQYDVLFSYGFAALKYLSRAQSAQERRIQSLEQQVKALQQQVRTLSSQNNQLCLKQ